MEDFIVAIGFMFYMIKLVAAIAIPAVILVALHHYIFER